MDAGTPIRVYAMILRYFYLFRGSWPRILELIYWPAMQMIIWGFITLHLRADTHWAAAASGLLVTAVLLWDVLFRGQLGVSISFLEEMWSRNMGHLFVSPLRPGEWVLSMLVMSVLRTLVGVVPAALLAMPFFGVNVFEAGLSLAAYFANLMMTGWWIAMIVISLILRFGMGAEGLAWVIVFMLAPVSAIYYPVDVLPFPLQMLAFALPPAHVFEGMRALVLDGVFSRHHLLMAAGLNVAYMAVGVALFRFAFDDARRRGALLQQGE